MSKPSSRPGKRAYFDFFRDRRFTRQDLWRVFANPYLTAGGKDAWPKDDFMAWLDLGTKTWIESAPGVRGGEGWRLSRSVVQHFTDQHTDHLELRTEVCERINQVEVRLGELTVQEHLSQRRSIEIWWMFEPSVPIPGPDINQRRRDPLQYFIFAASATTPQEELQRRVEAAETHVMSLIEAEQTKITANLRVLQDLLEGTRRKAL